MSPHRRLYAKQARILVTESWKPRSAHAENGLVPFMLYISHSCLQVYATAKPRGQHTTTAFMGTRRLPAYQKAQHTNICCHDFGGKTSRQPSHTKLFEFAISNNNHSIAVIKPALQQYFVSPPFVERRIGKFFCKRPELAFYVFSVSIGALHRSS